MMIVTETFSGDDGPLENYANWSLMSTPTSSATTAGGILSGGSRVMYKNDLLDNVSPNQFVTVINTGTGVMWSGALRMSANGGLRNGYFMLIRNDTEHLVRIYSVIDGSSGNFFLEHTQAGDFGDAEIRLEAVGSVLRIRIRESGEASFSTVATVEDSTFATGNVGIGLQVQGADMTYWEGGDVSVMNRRTLWPEQGLRRRARFNI
jgi:hypothetical protein